MPYVYDENGRRVAAPTKGERREQAILDSAERQLLESGADALTVESIATSAGITRASLYFYFRSKNDVLAALVARAVAELTTGVSTSDVTTEGAAAAIGEAIARTAALWSAHPAVLRAAVELSPRVPSIAAMWSGARREVEASALRIALAGGAPDGTGPTDAPAVVRSLVAMTEQAFYDAVVAGREPTSQRATQELIWVRALRLD